MTPLMLKQIFAYVSGHDSERCVLRVVCEVAAEPNLAGPQGKTVAEFMTALSREDASAPWMPYRDAAIAGQESADRWQCRERYPSCTTSTVSGRGGPLPYLTGLRNRRLSHVTARRHAPCARSKIVQVCSRDRCTILTPTLNFIEE
ncbi:uncharacterized protein LOC142765071 [Rhipicephalus microplus]|uniref:uncharacterized protein LOC142765071 n=1 Tax=Rhipicephalus microplus TaxID=6941 RepID=UPI003F6A581A